MKLELDGNSIHVATGGRRHVEGRPFVVFLHGSGNSHLTWVSQSRALAYDGYNVIAADMPGHNLSGGEPIEGVGAQAEFVLRLFDALDCPAAVLVGHSQGGLIALEIARTAPARVTGIVFIATAAAIPVNPGLIEMAEKTQPKAIEAMTDWGHGPAAHRHDNTWPGASHIFYGIEVMEQNAPMALARDLKACSAYQDGLEIAAALDRPTLCIFADKDRMTPLKAGRALAEALPDNELHILAGAGHMLPLERPREVTALLRGFLKRVNARHAASLTEG